LEQLRRVRVVWICDEVGELHILDGSGERADSALIAGIPHQIG